MRCSTWKSTSVSWLSEDAPLWLLGCSSCYQAFCQKLCLFIGKCSLELLLLLSLFTIWPEDNSCKMLQLFASAQLPRDNRLEQRGKRAVKD